MVERGISAGEVREAVLTGTKTRQEDRIIAAHRYFEVVYRRDGETAFVITVKPRW